MKFTWLLILSFFLCSVDAPFWAPKAFAVSLNGTNSNNNTSNDIVVVNGQQATKNNDVKVNYMPTQTQQKSEENTRDLNKQGQKQSNAAGMAAIAAGMAMIAAGVALNATPCACGGPLIAAGAALVAAGMAALAAGKKAGQNADTAQGHNKNLNNIASNTVDGSGASSADSIKVDPSLLNHPKFDKIMKELEDRTGIDKDNFAKSMEAGMTPQEMLANAPKKIGSAAEINAAFEKNAGEPLPSNQEVMDKLGLTQEDLAEMAGGPVDLAGGAKTASSGSSSSSFDGLFNNNANQADPNGASGLRFPASNELSPEVQAALDKNGMTGRSIFEMVHTQYKKKTPLMFGLTERKINGASGTNPYEPVTSGGVEL